MCFLDGCNCVLPAQGTALHLCVERKWTGGVKALIEAKAKLEVVDEYVGLSFIS
jgi:hypothetical protein